MTDIPKPPINDPSTRDYPRGTGVRYAADDMDLFDTSRVDLQDVLAEEATRKADSFTCYHCPHKNTCEYAWDVYNIDGDCLAIK